MGTESLRRQYRRALGIAQTEVWLSSELGTLRHPMVARCVNDRCDAPVEVPGSRCQWCASFEADLHAQSQRV